MLTFALAAYAIVGDIRVAAAAAVAPRRAGAARDLHGWVKAITWPELRSGLILLAMTFIALPIMPDDPIGPFGGVNPREVWLIAIVLAGVSFLGYVAVKYFGARHGMLLAAAAGGLVSSTAVTVANARRAGAGEGAPRLLAAGVALATAVSFVRVIAIVAALNPSCCVLLAPAAWRRDPGCRRPALRFSRPIGAAEEDARQTSNVRNPFGSGRWSALRSAGGDHRGRPRPGELRRCRRHRWLHPRSACRCRRRHGLDGAPDAAAAQRREAALAILAAVASNTVSKIVIGAAVGRGRFAIEIAVMSVACAWRVLARCDRSCSSRTR